MNAPNSCCQYCPHTKTNPTAVGDHQHEHQEHRLSDVQPSGPSARSLSQQAHLKRHPPPRTCQPRPVMQCATKGASHATQTRASLCNHPNHCKQEGGHRHPTFTCSAPVSPHPSRCHVVKHTAPLGRALACSASAGQVGRQQPCTCAEPPPRTAQGLVLDFKVVKVHHPVL
jgi:hypothetical protein